MDKKTNYLKKVTSLVLATTMLISIVPPRVFAQGQNTGNQQILYQVQPTTTKQTGKTKSKTSLAGL